MNTDLPEDRETLRLRRFHELLILDSGPDPVFDSLARLASEICRTPIAILSLVDERRQWFKASVGLGDLRETPREVSFCPHAIRGDDILEVGDARADPRFARNSLVTGTPLIRFYAGAPLTSSDGSKIGTLCVIDREPRQLTAEQSGLLKMLAQTATQAVALRANLLERTLAAKTRFEQQIAESEAQHQSLMDNQAEFVSLAPADGKLTYVNRVYVEHFGKAAESLIGASLFDFIEAKDRLRVSGRIADVMATAGPLSGENRMIGADGTEYWTWWTNRRFLGPGGVFLLHSVGRDVTERHRSEQALRESQALLTRTGRVAGVGGWGLDLKSRHLRWSEETRRIHEVPADYRPTVDRAVEFYPAEARAVIEAALKAASDQGSPWDLTLPLVTASGRKRWVRTLGEADFEENRPVRLAGTVQDVTDQAAAEKALEVLATIFLNTTDFVVQTDREGNVTYMNPAARAACAIAESDSLAGRTFSDFCPPETARLFEARVLPALKKGDLWLGETRMYLADRRSVPIMKNGTLH